jgi:adenosylcobyric acid synthase
VSRHRARAIIIHGTSSSAGKSLIATGLCRHFARLGLRVAPFKAQNMSNNARVVRGGEIGVAQYLQALAARVEPDVRMNPVLVKPEGDTRSQVVVAGGVDPDIGALAWRDRAERLRPAIDAALTSLMAEYELLVLEGAGSPAEINLADIDLTNLHVARQADARSLLVTDIDRGGAFAHLYGTWALMSAEDRARIAGFILNRFRGDPALLPPAPQRLEELTGVPVVGVVPWLAHRLPDEDGAATPPGHPDGRPAVAIVRYPTASNLDEYKALEEVADVRWVADGSELAGADLIVLPGSKNVSGDLAWLRRTGLARAVAARAAAGERVLGICGGLQMLGERLLDPDHVDGEGEALGLLPIETVFSISKLTERVSVRFATLPPPWEALGGISLDGYEIRHGRSHLAAPATAALPDQRGWVEGSVLGVTLHGLFEAPAVTAALLGVSPVGSLDAALDELADGVVAGLEPGLLSSLAA